MKNLKIRKSIYSILLSTCILTSCSYQNKNDNIEFNNIEEAEDSLDSIKNKIDEITSVVISKDIERDMQSSTDIKESGVIGYSLKDAIDYYSDKDIEFTKENSDEKIIIEKYHPFQVLYIDDDYAYVLNDLDYGYVSTKDIKEIGNDYIEVDIENQRVVYYKYDTIILEADVVTGTNNRRDTHIGAYSIYSMETNRYLTGPGYRAYVNYWMPFDGGIGFHDATWRELEEFNKEEYITNGSHGCVNLKLEDAEKIYENSSKGTKVLVHK